MDGWMDGRKEGRMEDGILYTEYPGSFSDLQACQPAGMASPKCSDAPSQLLNIPRSAPGQPVSLLLAIPEKGDPKPGIRIYVTYTYIYIYIYI